MGNAASAGSRTNAVNNASLKSTTSLASNGTLSSGNSTSLSVSGSSRPSVPSAKATLTPSSSISSPTIASTVPLPVIVVSSAKSQSPSGTFDSAAIATGNDATNGNTTATPSDSNTVRPGSDPASSSSSSAPPTTSVASSSTSPTSQDPSSSPVSISSSATLEQSPPKAAQSSPTSSLSSTGTPAVSHGPDATSATQSAAAKSGNVGTSAGAPASAVSAQNPVSSQAVSQTPLSTLPQAEVATITDSQGHTVETTPPFITLDATTTSDGRTVAFHTVVANPTSNPVTDAATSQSGFFGNHAAVGATFAVVGLASIILLLILFVGLGRRARRNRQSETTELGPEAYNHFGKPEMAESYRRHSRIEAFNDRLTAGAPPMALPNHPAEAFAQASASKSGRHEEPAPAGSPDDPFGDHNALHAPEPSFDYLRPPVINPFTGSRPSFHSAAPSSPSIYPPTLPDDDEERPISPIGRALEEPAGSDIERDVVNVSHVHQQPTPPGSSLGLSNLSHSSLSTADRDDHAMRHAERSTQLHPSIAVDVAPPSPDLSSEGHSVSRLLIARRPQRSEKRLPVVKATRPLYP